MLDLRILQLSTCFENHMYRGMGSVIRLSRKHTSPKIAIRVSNYLDIILVVHAAFAGLSTNPDFDSFKLLQKTYAITVSP